MNGAGDGLIPQLTRHVWGIRIGTMPAEVQRQAKLCILDTIGVIVAGARAPDWKPLFDVERRMWPQREATVLTTGEKLGMIGAARVNAYLGDILELNDLTGGHGSIGNVSALLAVAQAVGANGAALVQAVTIGLEVTARVYAAYRPSMKLFTEVGMNPVAVNSAMGVAAGTAHLLGLDEAATAEAIAIGGTLAGWSPAEAIFGEGGTVKPMIFGAGPAAAGISAAFYAQAGMTGPARLLEGARGLFVTIARDSSSQAMLDRDIWYVANPRRKLHACCGYIHSPVDLMVRMRKDGAPFEQAHRIIVNVGPHTVGTVSKPGLPRSGNEARFHLEWATAIAAAGSDVIVPDHSLDIDRYANDPAIAGLLRRIEVRAEPAYTHYERCAVTLLGADGGVLAHGDASGSRGSPQQPLSDDDVRGKFRALVAHCLDAAEAERYLERLQTLEHDSDWSWLISAFEKHDDTAQDEPSRLAQLK